MTLPVGGEIAFHSIAAELLQEPSNTNLDAAAVRTLAGKPAGTISITDLYGKTYAPGYLVRFGLLTAPMATLAELETLTSATITALPHQFVLIAGVNQYMYWFSPVSLGPIQFYDRESFFIGGWDGANNNFSIIGPRTISTPSGPHYVYRSDYANLGRVPWEAQVQT